ncbi:MAG TPA: helix-turn-helix domain-containing protein [Sporichthyaceae bacterium]|nr:helix-turn-helix domain-containing protein [Sporichthyaceae bacterium]
MGDRLQPGRPVRGSTSGEPVMALLDLLGRRWTLRVIWELRAQPVNFRGLQSCCGGVSSSVLNTRLAELRAAGAVTSTEDGYLLTQEGRALLELYPPLQAWADRWAEREGAETSGRRRAARGAGPAG